MSHFLKNFLHNVNQSQEDISEELYLLAIKENPKIISNGLLSKFNNEQFYIKLIEEDYTNLF